MFDISKGISHASYKSRTNKWGVSCLFILNTFTHCKELQEMAFVPESFLCELLDHSSFLVDRKWE
jgi:hypothetical protein